MELSTTFKGVKFTEDVIRKSIEKFDKAFNKKGALNVHFSNLTVEISNNEWKFDEEDHFFMSYKDCTSAHYSRNLRKSQHSLEVASISFHYHKSLRFTIVRVEARDKVENVRTLILEVMEFLSSKEQQCRLPEDSDSNLKIFIGHGHSKAWRELKDHLVDKHNYSVSAYETGARAGHGIRDILQSMLNSSTFALLVLTKEDETKAGGMRARQNVVHETGLFQGKLGFTKAIVLVEEGTETFSNIACIEQIRFNSISETFGEVIATIKREFK